MTGRAHTVNAGVPPGTGDLSSPGTGDRSSPGTGDALPTAVRAAQALAHAAPELDRRPLLIVSDFDGTLSQIVQDPWSATMLGSARRALRRLAGRNGVHVAILSGRTAADVATRARVGGATYLGNHGLESGRLGRRQRAESLLVAGDTTPAEFGQDAERVATEVAGRIGQPWLIVERKGPAVAFHYRSAPDLTAAYRELADAVDAADPSGVFVRVPGRRVLELRPPGATAKGQAMRRLLDEVRPAVTFILGDDRSDAEAFAVLAAARSAGQTRGLALAVQAHAEAPPEVAEAADVLLASPREAAAFLAGLARAVDADVAGAVKLRRRDRLGQHGRLLSSRGKRGLEAADRVAQLPRGRAQP
ncbi:MAG: trehalose-phosphatase, partial [Chloroflexota bacterium]|nr:trehalose-phosphatase [Chloroflexota bacterium]